MHSTVRAVTLVPSPGLPACLSHHRRRLERLEGLQDVLVEPERVRVARDDSAVLRNDERLAARQRTEQLSLHTVRRANLVVFVVNERERQVEIGRKLLLGLHGSFRDTDDNGASLFEFGDRVAERTHLLRATWRTIRRVEREYDRLTDDRQLKAAERHRLTVLVLGAECRRLIPHPERENAHGPRGAGRREGARGGARAARYRRRHV
mmetsp:Transcript_6306/g.16339  ORF Transcript_6306/g.16339 Transcript_6306/m.16339 type:complete len:207 (-) Transcript_6306:49-669(-)